MENKKAISPLWATVILVLITMCAVAIIWWGIMPLMNEIAYRNQMTEEDKTCQNYADQNLTDFGFKRCEWNYQNEYCECKGNQIFKIKG